MNTSITGIHHITAIASDAQRNVDFYAGALGLRLVKKTVNFDDPTAYHLYYGDERGTPGSIVTFFYWPGLGARGRIGSGQPTALVFSAPPTSLDFWQERLAGQGVKAQRVRRFGEEALCFADPDQIPVEIVAVADDAREGWNGMGIPGEHALRGLHAFELASGAAQATESLLRDVMGYRFLDRFDDRVRFEVGPGGSGTYVDLLIDASLPTGRSGSGTIHHVAWNVPDDEAELQIQALLRSEGYPVSGVMDRSYFHSIYYRERGGTLFEIATAGPGFAADEPADALGTELKLPPQFESARRAIEKALPPVEVPDGRPF